MHAKLSPSASERWINCPISVHLSEGFEDTKSVYAAEGTLAHKLAELKLRETFLNETPGFEEVRTDPLYNPEMEEYTDEYLEAVRAVYNELEYPHLEAETRLDMRELLNADCYGTADCILIAPGELHVFDFKYGKNVEVNAEGNSQMRLYALGALELFDPIYGVEQITTHIVQPRMNNFSAETNTADFLRDWTEKTLKPAVHKAVSAEGTPCKGEWCIFCRAKAVCRAYGETYENPPGRDLPPLITNEEVAYRISLLEGVDTYLRELKEFATNELLTGGEIPGYKVVEGRSNRVWADQDRAFETAENAGYERSELYEEKPLSISKLEKKIGKRKFNDLLGAYVEKPKGKPTLVKDTDKRTAYTRESPLEDFKNVEV